MGWYLPKVRSWVDIYLDQGSEVDIYINLVSGVDIYLNLGSEVNNLPKLRFRGKYFTKT